MKSIYGMVSKFLVGRGWRKLKFGCLLLIASSLIPPAAESLQRYQATSSMDEVVLFLTDEFETARITAKNHNRRVVVRFAPGNLLVIEIDRDANGHIGPGEGMLLHLPAPEVSMLASHDEMVFTGSGRLTGNSPLGEQLSQLVRIEHEETEEVRFIRVTRKGFVALDHMQQGGRHAL